MTMKNIRRVVFAVSIVLNVCLLALLNYKLVQFEQPTGTAIAHISSCAKQGTSLLLDDRNPIRHFDLPVRGERYELFQPLYDWSHVTPGAVQVGPADGIIADLSKRYEWLDTLTVNSDNPKLSATDRARVAYVELMKQFVSGAAFNDAERSVNARLGKKLTYRSFNIESRKIGRDWAYLGETMTGWARLDNVRDLVIDVIKNGIEGDYIETGVWRGGSSMFARAVLYAYGGSNRKSFVCDSFQGLPPGDRMLDKQDEGWDHIPYLEVAAEIVLQNFQKYNLLDPNVIFAKGFFNETMPPLSKRIDKLSVMRLDGDMYESTVDVLYNLYDKLSIGGYVIMDDWFGFPSRTACEDFFSAHGFQPKIIAIDKISAYWKKTEQVDIQYWRYQQNKFKNGESNTRT
jgi:hypothetical protein